MWLRPKVENSLTVRQKRLSTCHNVGLWKLNINRGLKWVCTDKVYTGDWGLGKSEGVTIYFVLTCLSPSDRTYLGPGRCMFDLPRPPPVRREDSKLKSDILPLLVSREVGPYLNDTPNSLTKHTPFGVSEWTVHTHEEVRTTGTWQ